MSLRRDSLAACPECLTPTKNRVHVWQRPILVDHLGSTMRLVVATAAALVLALTTHSTVQAFTPSLRHVITRSVVQQAPHWGISRVASTKMPLAASSVSSSEPLTVGIVGATGAVGKEIRSCLENRGFPVSQLRIFGSARSAGTEQQGITVELFSVEAAQQCDVVFLAVSGDFALEHAEQLSSGPNACVVIDNSVRE
jgi:Semialdehyde dehydrogenase, NAD binding domain